MLVLTRKLNERIVIGDNIRITVVGIRGNHVRLGFEAPQDLTILRDELHRKPRSEHSEAEEAGGMVMVDVPVGCAPVEVGG